MQHKKTSAAPPRIRQHDDVSAARRRGGEGADAALSLAAFAAGSDDIFWLADAQQARLLYVSPRVAHYFGVTPQRLLDEPRRWNDAIDAADALVLPQPFFDDPAVAPVREYRVHGPDGLMRWIRDRRFRLHDGRGRRCVAGIVEDITERKRREHEREALLTHELGARAEAESLATTRDEFLAVVTHELRSPLNAIRGWAHVLRKTGVLDALQEKALDAIDRNTQAQARLVDDLLDSQRILCGNLALSMSRLPLATLVDETVQNLQPTAQVKGIRLEADHDAAIGSVTVDVARLLQALGNLVSNALKFTPEAGIVRVRTSRRAGAVCIEVADTGAGLEPAQLAVVFDRFRQGDSSNSRRHNGLGLGLSLAHQLVVLHGGDIEVHSDGPGHGATFTVVLPDSVLTGPVAASPQAVVGDAGAELAGKRILIVEDDDDGREILESILREAHADPLSFARTAGAYDFLAHAGPDELPDALISDIAMPDEDGYDFIRRVRALEGEEHRHRLVALALTAFARLEDRRRALVAGFDEHMPKPIDSQEVLHTLARTLGSADEATPVPAPRPARPRAARRPPAR